MAGLAGHVLTAGGSTTALTALVADGAVLVVLLFAAALGIATARLHLTTWLEAGIATVKRWGGHVLIAVGLWLLLEHEFPVMPLAVPTRRVTDGSLREYSAVQLFVEAARAVRPDFALDDRSTEAVVAICRALDGLPLALELAAAMVRIMTPEMLLDRLRDRFPDLRGGQRDMPARHQSLGATIAWSHDLLDGPTKEAFAQLSAFRGGFTLTSAERVCDFDGDVLSAVASLAEQSLLRTNITAEHGVRFVMLSTIRQFASERLDTSARRDAVLARHARTFLEVADSVGRPGGRHRMTLDAMEIELDNVRQAFTWSLANDDPDPVATAMWESWWFWWMRGYLSEGRLWADRCLEAPRIGREPRACPRGASHVRDLVRRLRVRGSGAHGGRGRRA